MGFLDAILRKNKEIEFLFDLDIFENTATRVHMKRLAIDICVSFLARTISQSEFRVKDGTDFIKDDLYYHLNVRPNKNMTASTFWQEFVYKSVYNNECLIIQGDDGDLLIADDFQHNKYAVYEDTFTNVIVRDYEFVRAFPQSKVIHLKYKNEKLTPLIDGLFKDYGELFGQIFNSQKRKGQIRGTVDMDLIAAKTDEQQKLLQEFIDKLYNAIATKDVAIVPQQKGFEYKEHSTGSGTSPSIDEINKVTDGFLDQVAMALGIPLGLLHGDMADVEKQTKNYMMFTVNPFLKRIKDEGNAKFFTKEEYLRGKSLDIRPVQYLTILDLATAVDKLRASGVMNANELRSELGLERVDDPMLDTFVMTKNYSRALEGGETNAGD